ncbi:MAG: undecaprenyl-diphosphate phosphatase, partial [Oscillospiraceae bacterium]|nr:undecaprenyl-diphosphate phosphatase [Oscillospiraceae bacterium]
MSLLESIWMGIIQGITEFLPVSSSGHLVIFQNVFQLDTEGGLLFWIMLHAGTMLVVLWTFHRDIKKIFLELLGMCGDIVSNGKIFFYNKKQDEAKRYKKIVHNNYRKFALLLFFTAISTTAVGYVARNLVLFSKTTLIIPSLCFFVMGILLLVSDLGENGHRIPKDVGYGNGIVIGIMQGIAVIPGLSSLGMVLSVCILSGFQRKFAVK